MRKLQRCASRTRQRGLSFFGLVLLGVIIVSVVAVGSQAIPIFLEFQAIRKAVAKAASEGSTVADVRADFDRAAAIDDISSISGKNLEVTKEGDKVVVSFAYQREIALVGPAYLTFKFEGKSN
ncbi:DUF4845 domain-containing protein [Ramlibacter sp. H39-3-26]|uniref:DUF4845 domain-containing protein n=1 Tax=Curvibacter soli TaxID=3031331 RepID=UPI0023DCEB5D|nr:DUF4845 domain-containing protein [Ramlibacter sp. H39-3-26]MDF1484363.1 DUF4845 domain-containing protein [Ramlibacter sp. H39-3-26]